ncbi:MAG: hypothetical protein IJV37_02290 [Bacteroidales bacterium]|nr:hypothetical protein [Bacteroidales bacterium]
MKMTLTITEMQAALAALDDYFGIQGNLLPEKYRNAPAETMTINFDWDADALQVAFNTICDRERHSHLFRSLCLLVDCLLTSPALKEVLSSDELFSQMRQREYLRLYQLARSTRDDEVLTLRNNSRSIRLNNYSNWFVHELLDPFLKEKLAGLEDLESALRELDTPKPARKGRRPDDPRVAILLWGSYEMITDAIAFSSPMPNNLCNFLITLLQLAQVLPTSPVIDAFWIRAQLRYVRSRPVKPRFPIKD